MSQRPCSSQKQRKLAEAAAPSEPAHAPKSDRLFEASLRRSIRTTPKVADDE